MLTPFTYGLLLTTAIMAIVLTILAVEKLFDKKKRRTAGDTVRRVVM